MVVVLVKNKIPNELEMNSTALKFVEYLNGLADDFIEVDFTGVDFMTRSFAQGYYSSKLKSDKQIIEINVSQEIQPMFDIMEKILIIKTFNLFDYFCSNL